MKQFKNGRFFSCSDHVTFYATNIRCANKLTRYKQEGLICTAFCQTNRLLILLERAETEIRFSMANGTFKMKMDINRHGHKLMPNNCKNLNPPYFLLPTTFNEPRTINNIKNLVNKIRLKVKQVNKVSHFSCSSTFTKNFPVQN